MKIPKFNSTKIQAALPFVYAGAAAFLLYKVVKLIPKLPDLTDAADSKEAKEREAKEAEARQTELEKSKKAGSRLTAPESSYYSAADAIWNSLRYSSLDDNANTAQRAFTSIINSEADLAKIKEVYGKRPTYSFGMKEGDFSLLTTLQREFSNSRLNSTIEILKKKGVALSF